MSNKPPRIPTEELIVIRNKIYVMSPIVRRWVRGKGFSVQELLSVGLDIEYAKKIRLPIDKRRKSVHKQNVDLLREILEKYPMPVETQRIPSPPQKIVKVASEAVAVGSRPDVKEELSDEEISSIADQVVDFLDRAKRRGIRKTLEVFVDAIRKYAPLLLRRWSEEKMESIVSLILKDLSSAGFGSLSTKFFTKKADWDASMAREIILERLKRVLKE